ncbi:MAG: hypothetical protein ACXWC9_01115 [Pseudobdellovibrionaceae bacterium]
MKQKLKILFTIICLMATSVVTIATSKKSESDRLRKEAEDDAARISLRHIYLVASNCPQALSHERITVEADVITSPVGTEFSHFGLPMDELNFLNQQISGYMQGQLRTCQYSILDDHGTRLDLYTCYQNNIQICQVTFEKESVF